MAEQTPTDVLLARLRAVKSAQTQPPSTLNSSANSSGQLPEITTRTSSVAPGQVNPPESVNAPPPSLPLPVLRGTPAQSPVEDEPPADTAPATPVQEEKPKRKYTRKYADTVRTGSQIGTLYLGCFPMIGEPKVTQFEYVLERATEIIKATEFHNEINEPFHIDDYRMMPFGRGPAVLLAAVLQALQETGHVDHLAVMDIGTPESAICIQNLIAHSDKVVRAR